MTLHQLWLWLCARSAPGSAPGRLDEEPPLRPLACSAAGGGVERLQGLRLSDIQEGTEMIIGDCARR